jgi:type 1 fimbria pilin
MKARVFISLIAISMLLLISSDAYGQRQRRAAKEVTITGEVVSVMCYLKDGSRGMGHRRRRRRVVGR